MKKLIENPFLIFFISIPFVLFIGFLMGDALLDFNVHDTYFVVASIHLAYLISIIFGVIALAYWGMHKLNRKLSKLLNLIHIGLTFGGIASIWILSKFYREEVLEYEYNNSLTLVIISIFLLIIFGQIIFSINLIYGLLKKKPSG
ncbi:MAG: cbb3-type cytochrome c oxidase subunit I [Eudoraea sp.]|nr:cbb3-type cytochrome c oxidase subunit I [Eudoraea sp.]